MLRRFQLDRPTCVWHHLDYSNRKSEKLFARHYTSNTKAWVFAKALFTARAHGWHQFVSMQNHYNLAYREDERDLVPLCIDQGVAMIPWRPLARGFLTGNRDRSGKVLRPRAESDRFSPTYREDDYDIVDAVAKVAAARGSNQAQVALAWLLQSAGSHRAYNRGDQVKPYR